MQGYYGTSDGDWSYHPLAAFPTLCSSSPLLVREEEATGYLPMIHAPSAADDHYTYPLDIFPPLPSDGATAGLDDALLLPFSDIDLGAFGGDVDEYKATPLDTAILPVDHHFGAQQQNAVGHDHHDDKMVVATVGYAVQQARPPAVLARRARSSNNGTAAPPGRTRLDHIGFEELRRYFYMPITKAAREMNVGLTVLKKRCRELGVARWPHRKMKSLKSLILNVQEMGKGMSPAAVQRELAALETHYAQMEENPAIDLTERTKKLRQACFKESYKRRAASKIIIDRCYNFGHRQQPLPPTNSRHSQRSSFLGY